MVLMASIIPKELHLFTLKIITFFSFCYQKCFLFRAKNCVLVLFYADFEHFSPDKCRYFLNDDFSSKSSGSPARHINTC